MNQVEWLKFKVGMFDGHSFKKIKRAKIDGVVDFRDKLTAVWFELIDLAGKVNNNGYYFNDDLAYTNFEEIAIMIDRTEKEVELCINWFIQNDMMERINSHLLLTNFTKYQNNDGLKKIREQNRLRQQKYRERQQGVLQLETVDTLSDPYFDKNYCVYCGTKESIVGELTIDHIIPISKGGSGTAENLVKACKSCNSKKTNKDLVEFLNDTLRMSKGLLDIEKIVSDEKLSKHVRFNGDEFENVTLPLRYSNASPLISNSYSNTSNSFKDTINIILEYLNIKAKKRFKNVESNAKFIRARLEEGYNEADLKQVIDTKVADWLDTDHAKYLRPETLFNATKFQSYINEIPKEREEKVHVPTSRY